MIQLWQDIEEFIARGSKDHYFFGIIIINCYNNDTRFGLIDAMYYKMLRTVRSKEIPFHFLHVQNTNQVIENIYSVVKAEVE